MNYAAVIVAAGKSTRFSGEGNKLFYVLPDGVPVLMKTLNVFVKDERCERIALVVNDEGMDFMEQQLPQQKVVVVRGGDTRQQSVYNGLLATDSDIVLIHDGARPWVDEGCIDRLLEALESEEAAILTIPVADTMKRIENGYLVETIDRDSLRRAQTPQGFVRSVLTEAYKEAIEQGLETTDDAMLYQTVTGKPVKNVEGSYDNIKITTISDVK
ncbi:MAG: 2-C-methyl-D-erythritol 4-phosphate cytidylyltransferase [Erysipelotrichaceae bacterium]|nr:2-C-methyl-D-erythritol 4-phosphate cytidylyltransferase [Erysipelotrichaceae bacterium]